MLFNSYEFLLAFMPVFIIGYFLIRHFYRDDEKLMRLCNLWIIAGSLVFYALFGVKNLMVLAASIVINACFFRGFKLGTIGKDKGGGFNKKILAIGICLNILSLLFFKFSGVFFPIAISFYTFNQISYLVDFYRGDIEKFDLLEYLSYILFFPKLLQGPLMRYDDFACQLKESAKKSLDWEMVMRGLLLISLGLFKKVILADTIGQAVDYGYNSLATLGWWEAVLVAVFYSFQLYFDFSGYCDVAGGICMILGFELSLNFDSPYKAVNIIDFWNRWHITLTKFFTGYIYIPLGGSRKGLVRTYANIMIVFLVSGLWHGSGWTFIVWGAMHGALNAITRATTNLTVGKKADGLSTKLDENQRENHKENHNEMQSAVDKTLVFLKKCGKRLFTFIYVTAAWVFFRANTISDALLLFKRMFSGGIRPYYSDFANYFRLDEIWYVFKLTPIVNFNFAWDMCMWLFLAASVVIVFFGKSAINYAKECRIGIFTTLLTALLLVWCVLSFGGVSTFLYMNF
ncbi:MBOAT, membrane-bound O-acyltransferase family [Butyrivibrio proteoclasticus]|uniref:MBOAT, membrane-bound O-acyltransferase family n=1 Tax=Butyrivibrio proteoclasticus TaxID=43305 RepID=A0A1I5VND9_9FIRM|nr:MBOAT family O-acyltransferase [Butyrivibrio proteoclasticus]SFQ08951.1 MBOAT, membrane-bound O-acyltransferase family [Butyrivibrio proteoclasticus]